MKSLIESILDDSEDIISGAETDVVKGMSKLGDILKRLGPTSLKSRGTNGNTDVFGNKLGVGDIFFIFGHADYPVVGYYIYGYKRNRLVAKKFAYESNGNITNIGSEMEYIDNVSGKIKWPIKV